METPEMHVFTEISQMDDNQMDEDGPIILHTIGVWGLELLCPGCQTYDLLPDAHWNRESLAFCSDYSKRREGGPEVSESGATGPIYIVNQE